MGGNNSRGKRGRGEVTMNDTDWPYRAVGGLTKAYSRRTARSLIHMLYN